MWAGRWCVVVVTAIFAISGFAYTLLAREWYQADVVLIQADNKGTSSTLGQLGNLASLAGINIGSVGGKSPVPLAVLRSRDFAREFIQDEKLLQVIMFSKVDAKTGKWIASDPKKQPDIRDAVTEFDKHVRDVSEDKKTGLVTLSITWTDPETAAEWANVLVGRLNTRLRNQAIVEAEANIDYLQGQMASTSIPPLQQSIGKVLESEMEKLMLARGEEEFAFKIIDAATPPKKRQWPKGILIVVASAVFGALLATTYLLVQSSGRLKLTRTEAPNSGEDREL